MSNSIKINDYQNGKDKEWLREHPGRQTASITKIVELPVKWLITLPGLRGEDKKLNFNMPKIKNMAKSCVLDKNWRDEHPALLEVHFNGDVVIADANHRIRAAKLAGLKTFPCVINFYGGGEDKFSINKILNKYAEDSAMTNIEKLAAMDKLIQKAKVAIENDLDYKQVIAEIQQLASESGGNLGGDTDTFGSPTDQEYQNYRDSGEDLSGENSPDKDEQRRTGPRNDMVQEASSNKPCATCGMPTDSCVCMDSQQPTNGKNPARTEPKLDPQLDPTRHNAAYNALIQTIKSMGLMSRYASNMQEVEIPFKELNLVDGTDYKMLGKSDNITRLVDKYLRMNVYQGNRRYTIARIEIEKNKLFVKVLVFDNQIEHEGSFDTKDGRLNKVSSVKSNKLQKTAWKMRLTEVIGDNDKTGLVRCPLEGGFLTRSCGTCPFAGNPTTYIQDGGVQCHADEGSVWLNNLGVKEHQFKDNSDST